MRYLLAIFVLVAAACADGQQVPTTLATPTTTQPEGGLPSTPIAPAFGADGNRKAPWSGSFDTSPVTILRVREAPATRIDLPTDTAMALAYENGELRLLNAEAEQMSVRSVAATTAIVYSIGPTGIDVVGPLPDQAPHSRPAVLSTGQVAYVTVSGDVVVWDGAELQRRGVNALVDADILVDDRDRILVLTGPTDRYPHGILGDSIEASGFVVLEPPDLTVVGAATIEAPEVIEGRRPIWADMDGDARRDVLLTVSSPGAGARLRVMTEDGTVVSDGRAIGRGNRWRHQIAYGAFTTEPTVAEVVTPHIGGIATFADRSLNELANIRAFTSHQLGARELDMAIAIDVDGDGLLELVVPTQDRTALVGIGVVNDSAVVEWSADLPSPITSNIAAGTQKGIPTIAVGTRDGHVYMWQP